MTDYQCDTCGYVHKGACPTVSAETEWGKHVDKGPGATHFVGDDCGSTTPHQEPVEQESNGAVCGGVVKLSEFAKNPEAYMMAWIMPDDKFEQYKALKESGDRKAASKFFDEHARSVI